MSRAWRAVVLVSVVLSGCSCGPFLLLPGGKLSGTPAATPERFEIPGNRDTIQLETRPEDPYSVNVSGAVVDGKLYVSAGDTLSTWAKAIEANPLVRVRYAGNLYDLKARRVTDRGELQAFSTVWTSGNTFSRDPMKLGEVWVYQLGPRP
jgi:hypothetical protein